MWDNLAYMAMKFMLINTAEILYEQTSCTQDMIKNVDIYTCTVRRFKAPF